MWIRRPVPRRLLSCLRCRVPYWVPFCSRIHSPQLSGIGLTALLAKLEDYDENDESDQNDGKNPVT